MHTAVRLAAEGTRVFATMRNTNKAGALVELAKTRGVDLDVLELDVQKENSIHAAVARAAADGGSIDILVNNAGFGSVRSLEQATSPQINEIMDVNFFGVVRCIRAVLPLMRAKRFGRIACISSVGGLVGQPLNEIYCAAKFALEGLVESMATYTEAFFGIKMMLIEPAGIQTEFVNRVLTDLKQEKSSLEDVYGPILAKYIEQATKRGAFETGAQTPSEVADVVVDTLKDDSAGLRTQTSDRARDFAKEKLQGDPTGALLQKRIRAEQLGLD